MTDKKTKIMPAYKSAGAIALLVIVTALAAAADLWSKHAVFSAMLGDGSKYTQQASDEAKYLASFNNSDIPSADSQEFTRWVLQRLNIHKDICRGMDFTISTNPGVVFGFDAIPRPLVNLASVGMMLAVIVFFCFTGKKEHWLHVAFALILGGAIGNLYDRMFSYVSLPGLTPIKYHVRDFIDCSEIGYVWVFNIADAWLVIGVAMIVLHMLWSWKKEIRSKTINN